MNRSLVLKLLFIIALIVRLAAIPIGLKQAKSRGLSYYDEYGGIAKNIVEGEGFAYDWYGDIHPTSIHAPIYPFLLAGIFRLFGYGQGGTLAVISLNIFLSLLFLLMVFKSSEHLFGTLPAFITLAIMVFYPSQVYYGASGLPTVLYEGLLFLILLFTWKLKENLSMRMAIIWGLTIGICALAYTFVLLLAPLLALWILITADKARVRMVLGYITLAAVVALAVCIPWTIRNYCVHGRLIPIRDQTGTNLWSGNGPLATGGTAAVTGKSLSTYPDTIARELRAIPNEVDQDRYLKKVAIEYMRNHPKRTLRLWMLKIWNFWWFHEGTSAPDSRMERIMPVLKLLRALLIIFSVIGFAFLWRTHTSLVVLGILACFTITLVFMIFLSGKLRYFTPLEPILAFAAGYSISTILERYCPAPLEKLKENRQTHRSIEP